MWNLPIALTPAEQNMAQRTQKARKFFMLLRERRHARLEATFQETLAKTSKPGPGGTAPVEAGLLALATLVQAYGNVGDRDAVARTVRAKRWQRVLDCLGAEPPPCSQGTPLHLRMRLIAHNVAKTLLERPVAWAAQTGGCGARQRRAALDATPRCGASRVEETFNLLGHALHQAVGLAAQALVTSAEAIMAEAGLVLVGGTGVSKPRWTVIGGNAPLGRARGARG